MARTLAAWSLALGVIAGGWLVAHSVASVLAAPDGHERAHLLHATGHGWLDVRALGALCAGLALVGFLGAVVRSARGEAWRAPPRALLALLPLVAATVQEVAERLLSGAPLHALADPLLALVIALQAPFALVALLLLHLLLRGARALARRLGASSPARPRRSPPAPWPPLGIVLGPRACALGLGHGERGPPAPVSGR
jgi:hypothetical protein